MTRAMKPKVNRKGDKSESQGMDQCQTPIYAIEPLLPYLKKEWILWESAAGNGNIYNYLLNQGYRTVATDILYHPQYNFFDYSPEFDCQLTNPPYSCKYDWLERSLQLNKPFALLVPVEMIAAKTTDTLRREYLGDDKEFEYILFDKRIDFEMPNKGSQGSAQFPVLWLTNGLNINKTITRVKLNKPSKRKNI